MGMFPSVNADLQTQINAVTSTTTSSTPLGKSFLFDFNAGDFITQDGKLIVASDYEATKIWIEKILKTEKFKFKIYENPDTTMEYGVTLMDLIVGNNYPLTYLKAEITREVEEALLENPLIQSVDTWVFTRNKRTLSASFNVNLADGTIIPEEV